jgi:hypothetical protein
MQTKINDVNGNTTIIQLFEYANYTPFIGQMNRKPRSRVLICVVHIQYSVRRCSLLRAFSAKYSVQQL